MAESNLKVNSLRLRFERGNPEPTDYEVFSFMKGKMGLKCDDLLSMYKDKPELSVIIKFKTEESFKAALLKLPGSMEFAHNKYESSTVQISAASAVVRYVRLFNLPPEVEDREIWAVLSKYGKIQKMVREKYAEDTGFPIWTSVRGVYIELKEGGEIPATVHIRNLRARVYYEGLVNKCFQCGGTDHLKAECPKRKSVNDRLEPERKGTYSEALSSAGDWSRPKATNPSATTESEKTMTNLNLLFPAIPTEKRDNIEKKKEIVEQPQSHSSLSGDLQKPSSGSPTDEQKQNDKPSTAKCGGTVIQAVGAKGKTADGAKGTAPKRGRGTARERRDNPSGSDDSTESGELHRDADVRRASSLSEMQSTNTRSRSKQMKLSQSGDLNKRVSDETIQPMATSEVEDRAGHEVSGDAGGEV